MKIYSPNFSNILVGDSLGLSLNGIDTASVITPTENRDFCSLSYLIDRKWKGDNFWTPDQTGGTQIGLSIFSFDSCWYRITNTYDNPSIGIFDFFISASMTTETISKEAQFQIKIPMEHISGVIIFFGFIQFIHLVIYCLMILFLNVL
jgi:hypothetical protein